MDDVSCKNFLNVKYTHVVWSFKDSVKLFSATNLSMSVVEVYLTHGAHLFSPQSTIIKSM